MGLVWWKYFTHSFLYGTLHVSSGGRGQSVPFCRCIADTQHRVPQSHQHRESAECTIIIVIIKTASPFSCAAGTELTVSIDGSAVTIAATLDGSNATVVMADITACAGVVHAIDTVRDTAPLTNQIHAPSCSNDFLQ
jgi:Fasciclin domain